MDIKTKRSHTRVYRGIKKQQPVRVLPAQKTKISRKQQSVDGCVVTKTGDSRKCVVLKKSPSRPVRFQQQKPAAQPVRKRSDQSVRRPILQRGTRNNHVLTDTPSVSVHNVPIHRTCGAMKDASVDAAIARMRRTYDVFCAYRHSLGLHIHDAVHRVHISPLRLWQLSLTGAMILGMVSMSLIYHNLGQSAFAKDKTLPPVVAQQQTSPAKTVDRAEKKAEQKVMKDIVEKKAVAQEKQDTQNDLSDTADVKDVTKTHDVAQKTPQAKTLDSATAQKPKHKKERKKEKPQSDFEKNAYEMVKGYPIEKMMPYILDQDEEVAKYLIAIAKQESNWGKRVPVLNGQDCYNYWGYRSSRKLMGSGGHTCFNSREDAVETVGKRLNELVYDYDRKTAEKLVVWKCGSSCAGHAQSGVHRWIGVVDRYYRTLSKNS